MALPKKTMLLNVGPVHPALHGVIRLITELDGETIVKVEGNKFNTWKVKSSERLRRKSSIIMNQQRLFLP
jgi:NADH:ubiquinone oxidoreductase subunit D